MQWSDRAAMDRVEDVELIPLVAPLPPGGAYGMARGLAGARMATILRLRTTDGIEGLGECWGPPAVTRAYLDILRPYAVGRPVWDFPHVMSLVLSKHYHFGVQNGMLALLSGLDMAMLDAAGQGCGRSVAELLGGTGGRTRLPVYASGGYLTERPEQDFPAQLDRLSRAGAPAAKIKIGLYPRSDEARVAAARAQLGPDALLMVDANGNYTLDAALESIRRIAGHGIHWYEEPLPPQDLGGYAALRRHGLVALAAGEALYTAWDFKRLLDADGADVLTPDLSLCGGMRAGQEVALLARLHGVRLSPHVWGGAVGLAAACHWTASLPEYPHNGNVPYPVLVEYDVGENPLRDELLQEPVRLEAGHLVLPEGPGLGIRLDPDAVRRYRVDI